MDMIIRKAEALAGQKSLFNMRLVSTAWHDAIRGYPGRLQGVSVGHSSEVQALHWIMPNMISLDLSSLDKAIDMRGLSTLTRLTHLSLAPQSSCLAETRMTDISLACHSSAVAGSEGEL